MRLGNIFKIAICSLSLTQVITPASAVMLHGSVQTADFASAQPMPMSASLSPQAQRDARADVLEGNWKCVSQVVASNVPGVTPGKVVQSAVQYRKDGRGNLVELWFQNQWTPANSAVVKLDSDLLTSTHESTSPGNDGGAWSARSHDLYKIVAPTRIVAKSTVEQFVNGQFIGQYQTASVLLKSGS
jgi:hypothetical protein